MKEWAVIIVAVGFVGCGATAGAVGAQGLPGTAAQNCTVVQETEGAVISCPDGTTAFVQNGSPGKDCSEHSHGKGKTK